VTVQSTITPAAMNAAKRDGRARGPPREQGGLRRRLGYRSSGRRRRSIKKGGPMSLLGSILEKLGLKAKTAPTPPAAPQAPRTPPAAATQPTTPAAPAAPPRPTAISVVDVVAKLEGLAARNPQKLNWKVSIVDLLKLLDLNSSYEARKALATELGCPAELMGDSAKMNMWLHKTVLNKIAENGGNIPKELLD